MGQHVKIPRPPNSFMLYRADKSRDASAMGMEMFYTQLSTVAPVSDTARMRTRGAISRDFAAMWRAEPAAVRQHYKEAAERCKAEHLERYPHYRYRPVRKASIRDPTSPAVRRGREIRTSPSGSSGATSSSSSVPSTRVASAASSSSRSPSFHTDISLASQRSAGLTALMQQRAAGTDMLGPVDRSTGRGEFAQAAGDQAQPGTAFCHNPLLGHPHAVGGAALWQAQGYSGAQIASLPIPPASWSDVASFSQATSASAPPLLDHQYQYRHGWQAYGRLLLTDAGWTTAQSLYGPYGTSYASDGRDVDYRATRAERFGEGGTEEGSSGGPTVGQSRSSRCQYPPSFGQV
ncbi:hypothetical protein V8E36_001576 [Tilletia maclaganii]